jgi:hypothetical protein
VQKYKKLRTTYHKRALIHLAAKASPTGWPVLECIQVHWDHMLTCLCSRFIYSDVLSTWWCIIRSLYFFSMFVYHLLLVFGAILSLCSPILSVSTNTKGNYQNNNNLCL